MSIQTISSMPPAMPPVMPSPAMQVATPGATAAVQAAGGKPSTTPNQTSNTSNVSEQRAVQAPAQASDVPVDREELLSALEEVKTAISTVTDQLTFSIDEDSGRTLVKIVDSQTDELIRQIPSEEVLHMAKALGRLQGLLVKQEV